MRPPLDGHIVITGASSGIGRELARQLAPTAKKLVLVARRKDRLDALAAELTRARPELDVAVCPCDLSDLDATERLASDLLEHHGPVDVLVNNAGLGDIGLFEESDWNKILRLNRVNIDALVLLTHRLLPPMVARARGGILNVSSGFGMTVMPVMAAYVASKHYVTAFTESLRIELSGTGVVVSQVCPGPVETEFNEVAENPFGREPPRLVLLSPASCARAAVSGFRRGRALITPGFAMKILMFLGRITPRFVFRIIYRPLGALTRKRFSRMAETSRM